VGKCPGRLLAPKAGGSLRSRRGRSADAATTFEPAPFGLAGNGAEGCRKCRCRSVATRACRYRLVVESCECPVASLTLTGSTPGAEQQRAERVAKIVPARGPEAAGVARTIEAPQKRGAVESTTEHIAEHARVGVDKVIASETAGPVRRKLGRPSARAEPRTQRRRTIVRSSVTLDLIWRMFCQGGTSKFCRELVSRSVVGRVSQEGGTSGSVTALPV
jgi:hypothetical protein